VAQHKVTSLNPVGYVARVDGGSRNPRFLCTWLSLSGLLSVNQGGETMVAKIPKGECVVLA
jgi:hypothetical protein